MHGFIIKSICLVWQFFISGQLLFWQPAVSKVWPINEPILLNQFTTWPTGLILIHTDQFSRPNLVLLYLGGLVSLPNTLRLGLHIWLTGRCHSGKHLVWKWRPSVLTPVMFDQCNLKYWMKIKSPAADQSFHLRWPI